MIKEAHISYFSRLFISISLLLMYAGSPVFSQVSVTMGKQSFCDNSEGLIPINVMGFNDIVAFTLFIDFDSIGGKFMGIENVNSMLSGGVVVSNAGVASSRISIAWQSMSPASINNGKLFDLKIAYASGTSEFVFSNDCEIVGSDLNIISNVGYFKGLMEPAINITGQPQSVAVNEGGQARFSVELQDHTDLEFQWQQFNGLIWSDLVDEYPYVGVRSDQLTIENVPLAFNNFAYRCRIKFENCSMLSDSARLTSPLSVVENNSKDEPVLKVFPNPCSTLLNYKVNTSEKAFIIQLVDLIGEKVFTSPSDKSGCISLKNINPGIYFLQLIYKNRTRETVKVIIR